MALRDTLVYESVHLLILVCSFQWCVLFLCLAKLYRSCPIRDKDLFHLPPRKTASMVWHTLAGDTHPFWRHKSDRTYKYTTASVLKTEFFSPRGKENTQGFLIAITNVPRN